MISPKVYLYVLGHAWEILNHKIESSLRMPGSRRYDTDVKLTVKGTKFKDLEFFEKTLKSYDKIGEGYIMTNTGINYTLYGLIITEYNYNTETNLEITADFTCDHFEVTDLTKIEVLKRYRCSIKEVFIDELNLKY